MHCPKWPKQIRKHQCKSTRWVGAKEEDQLISKEDPLDLDPSMEEAKVDLEEIRDTPSKEDLSLQHVSAPQCSMNKESAYPSTLDQEAELQRSPWTKAS